MLLLNHRAGPQIMHHALLDDVAKESCENNVPLCEKQLGLIVHQSYGI